MKRQHGSNNSGEWEDFSHQYKTSDLSNLQIYKNFQAFRSQFRNLPKRELIERGWIESADDTASMAQLFFAVDSDSNKALFRKSVPADEPLLRMWIALIRTQAEHICIEDNVPRFHLLTKLDLRSIAQLSVEVNSVKELPALLQRRGIILVYLRGLTGMGVDGVVFKLISGHMVIGLSFRFPRLDYFWFTLMHELSHLVLHVDALDHPMVVDVENDETDTDEKAANKLAKESFVSRTSWRNCEPRYQRGSDVVKKYAQQEGVHPSIVAGLLRREFSDYTRYGDIINQHNVRDIIFG